jgi:hypothetical protein
VDSAPKDFYGMQRRAEAAGHYDRAPWVDVTRDGPNLVFWCTSCLAEHRHRVHYAGDGCMLGPLDVCTCPRRGGNHRTAHCTNPASPYRQFGYRLREIRPERQTPGVAGAALSAAGAA